MTVHVLKGLGQFWCKTKTSGVRLFCNSIVEGTGLYEYTKFNEYGTKLANEILDNSKKDKGIKIVVSGIRKDDIISVNEMREDL